MSKTDLIAAQLNELEANGMLVSWQGPRAGRRGAGPTLYALAKRWGGED